MGQIAQHFSQQAQGNLSNATITNPRDKNKCMCGGNQKPKV